MNRLPGGLNGSSALVCCDDELWSRALALRLLSSGASVILAGGDPAALRRTLAACRQAVAPSAVFEAVEIHYDDEEDVQKVVAKARGLAGGLDVCIAQIDSFAFQPLLAMSAANWWSVLAANVVSQFLLLKHAARVMRDCGGGTFISLSGDGGRGTLQSMGGYAAAKAAAELMLCVAAEEMAEDNVSVNLVRTGAATTTDTPLMRDRQHVDGVGSILPEPDEAAVDVVEFLAWAGAKSITGLTMQLGASGRVGRHRELMSRPDPDVNIGAPAATRSGVRGASVLVTGGGSSIGLASARTLASDGANVLIVGRAPARLQAACDDMARDGLVVDWMAADVTDERDVCAAVKRAMGRTGRLDVCVASAGIGAMAHLIDCPLESFLSPFRTNVIGTALTLKHATRAMKAGGSFIAIGSLSSSSPGPNLGAYGASKAALDTLVRVAADELGHLGIRCNVVRPGLTKREAPSPIFSNRTLLQRYQRNFPLVRPGSPEDSAFAVRYFAGPESSWVTGQCVDVDGGMSLRGRPVVSSIGPLAFDGTGPRESAS